MDDPRNEPIAEEAEADASEQSEQEQNRSLLKQLEQLGYIDAGLDI